MLFKPCSYCLEIKLVSEFGKNAHFKTGLQPRCKICHNPKTRQPRPIQVVKEGYKTCCRCGGEKELQYFYPLMMGEQGVTERFSKLRAFRPESADSCII